MCSFLVNVHVGPGMLKTSVDSTLGKLSKCVANWPGARDNPLARRTRNPPKLVVHGLAPRVPR